MIADVEGNIRIFISAETESRPYTLSDEAAKNIAIR